MQNKQAFTLIELLVVVLIIGILAAVAVPQYQVAVAKSRVGALLPAVKALADAEEVYFMNNGEYAMRAEELDVDISGQCSKLEWNGDDLFACGKHLLLDVSIDGGYEGVVVNYCPYNNSSWTNCRDNRDMQIVFYLQHVTNNPSYAGKRACRPLNDSKLGARICAGFSGSFQLM